MANKPQAPELTTRIERDSMGEVEVPLDAKWGASTQRAVNNFPIGGGPIPAELIHALGLVKAAAARSNVDVGVVEQGMGEAIALVSEDVAAGTHDEQFPVDVFQTGSGTSSNTNVNEVIAQLASERLGHAIHPNDHVNASQSSNDVFPTAIHVATALMVVNELRPALDALRKELDAKGEQFKDFVKPGRTHLMDAAPLTLGSEFFGYAGQVALAIERLDSSMPRLLELPLGGTAVGTGLNAPAGFSDGAIRRLSSETGLDFRRARYPFEAQSARDALVEVSGQIRTIAVSLMKICNDLRWMGSGPHAGLAEIQLPSLQPGSSIMPCKVNPVIPEAVVQVCARTIGNDTAITVAATTSAFELNTAMPLIADSLLQSIRLLSSASRVLAEKTVSGITADRQSLRASAESSPAIATSLNTLVGYDAASRVVKQALADGTSIREAAQSLIDEKLVTETQLDEALDVDRLARGG